MALRRVEIARGDRNTFGGRRRRFSKRPAAITGPAVLLGLRAHIATIRGLHALLPTKALTTVAMRVHDRPAFARTEVGVERPPSSSRRRAGALLRRWRGRAPARAHIRSHGRIGDQVAQRLVDAPTQITTRRRWRRRRRRRWRWQRRRRRRRRRWRRRRGGWRTRWRGTLQREALVYADVDVMALGSLQVATANIPDRRRRRRRLVERHALVALASHVQAVVRWVGARVVGVVAPSVREDQRTAANAAVLLVQAAARLQPTSLLLCVSPGL
jgi:hypothetical protein